MAKLDREPEKLSESLGRLFQKLLSPDSTI